MKSKKTILSLLIAAALFITSGVAILGQTGGLYSLPDARARLVTSSGLAINTQERIFAAVNFLTNTVSIFEPATDRVLAEIPVGKRPSTVAMTPDDSRVLVVNRGDGTLSVISIATLSILHTYPVGLLPYGVVALDNNRAIVTVQGTNEVVIVDLNNGDLLERIPTPDAPAGIALWDEFLYITHLWSGQLTLIYLPQMRLVNTIVTSSDASVSQSIAIDPARGLAYLPQTRLNVQNLTLTFDTTVFPIVNIVDLSTFNVSRRARIGLDTSDRPVNMPFAAEIDGLRRWIFVANAGSNDISVIDLTNNLAVTHIPVGSNPRSLRLSRNRRILYVHNTIEGTFIQIDTANFETVDVLPINNITIPADILIGAQLFHTSEDPRISEDRWLSCASCHFDGQSSGRVWLGYEGGPRNTPLLYDLDQNSLYNWSGTWDELADVEHKIRYLQAGDGLISGDVNPLLGEANGGRSLDLDNLTAYLLSLDEPATSPPPANLELVAAGERIFQAQGCGNCHSGNKFSDDNLHDVGTGGEFVTPTLRWLWMSAPYFHDGSAQTLQEVFFFPGNHQLIRTLSVDEIDALIAYLLSLPQPNAD